ncbi:MAG: ATP-binding protein [Nitrospirota bacterium]|nr:ATP-binding protein [Nitrospirota bacterium]
MKTTGQNPRLNEHLAKLIQSWNGTAFLIGAAIFPLLAFMDYFVSPENFRRFMIYRLAISAILIVLYYLNRLKRNIVYQYSICAVATALSAVVIELAVMQSGGQSSPYYAAMLILIICALGLVPISMWFAVTLVLIIYGTYVIPILLAGPVTSGVFISNNAFMVSMTVIALILRYHNQKLLVSEIQLREELSAEKAKLEHYTTGLQDLVDAKTHALADSEQKYRALFENAMDGIAVLDRKGAIVNVNARFCEIHDFPREALQGTPFTMLIAGGNRDRIAGLLEAVVDGAPAVYEADHFRRDGGRISLEISAKEIAIGKVPHIQLFVRDVTERKQLQEHVVQSQKLESMGVLAGGIAHDFNNIITAVLTHAEVLRRRVKEDDFAQRRIKTIEDSARRAGQMVTKLLSFSRKERLALVPTDLNAVVRDTVELLRHAFLERNATVRVRTDEHLPAILGDSIHIEQVITNLVLNALDALSPGGAITITTGTGEMAGRGAAVVLSVADTGTGIPRDIIDRIFDPFFTTKPPGKGTGLGLAMVYGIVKSHNGEVRVESREGEGSTFSVSFPASNLSRPLEVKNVAASEEAPRRGSGTILVVDDEKDILSSLEDILGTHGYTVMVADNPIHARELFRKRSGGIDAVLTDMVMPLVNGAELCRQIKEIEPSVPVIGMTGYEGMISAEDFTSLDGIIKKPFESAALVALIHQAVQGRGA